MADMYNKDYADDILRKLKQKIIEENPDAVDTLDAFADEAPPTDQGEEPEDGQDIDFDGDNQEDEDIEDEDGESTPIDVMDGELEFDGFDEEDESDFAEDSEDIAPWDVVQTDTQEPTDDTSVQEEAVAEEQSESVSQEEVVFTDGEESDNAPFVSVLDVPQDKAEESEQDLIEQPASEKTESTTVEDIPSEESIAMLETDAEEEQQAAEQAQDASPEEDILATFASLKRKPKILKDPEESVVVQNTDEQTDVLKRALPRGQKSVSSFFLHTKGTSEQNRDNAQEGGNSNRSITAWRDLLRHSRYTFVALVLTALLTLFIGCVECVPALRKVLFSFADNGGDNAAMLMSCGCLFACLLAFVPAGIQSVKRLSNGVADTEFVTACVAVLALLYQLIQGLVGKNSVFICFPFAFLLTCCQASRLFMCLAAQNSAEICLNSRNGTTAVLRRVSDLPDVKEAVTESEFDHHVVMSTAKLKDTNPFLARLEKEHISSRYNWISVVGAVAIGIISAVFSGIYQSPSPLGKGLAVLASAFPLSIYLIHNWSFYRLSKELKNAKMTVAGESAVHELANADVLCLKDVDAFPTENIKLTHIKLCEDKRFDMIFLRLNALFGVLGGPLNGLFSVSGEHLDGHLSVEMEDITPDGISARINGESILVGKGAYMVQKGVSFMYDAEDEILLQNPETPIMFVSCGGVSSAKIYLRYKMSETFESYVRHLSRMGISVILRTADPNISAQMIDRLSCLEKGSVGVVRTGIGVKTQTDALSEGIVGYGTKPQALYQTRFLFAAYGRMQQSLPWVSLAGIPLCGALCAISVAAGAVALPLMVVLYQLLGFIPTLCIIEAVLRKYTIGDNKNDQ